MDAPSWGDTGGHTGTAPTNLHQIPLPVTFSRFSPSAEPLPPIISCFSPSAEPLPATFFVLVRRRSLFRQPFLVLVRRRSLFRQPFLDLVRRRTVRWQPWDTEPYEKMVGAVPMCPPVSPHKSASVVHSPRTICVFFVWKRRCANVRAGTQAPPLRVLLERIARGCLPPTVSFG